MCIVKMYKLLCLEGAAVVLTALLQLMTAHGSIVYGSPILTNTLLMVVLLGHGLIAVSPRELIHEVYDVSVVL